MADSVQLSVDGSNKQHYIELENFTNSKGYLYTNQLISSTWEPIKKQNTETTSSNVTSTEVFATEVNEKVIEDARKRLESSKRNSILLSRTNFTTSELDKSEKSSSIEASSLNYLMKNPAQIKDDLIDRSNLLYNESLNCFEDGYFEKALIFVNKAFALNSFNIQFYLLKYESFIQLCDFKSALLTVNKLLSIISVWTNKDDASYDELKMNLLGKIVFCHYALGQTYFDSKFYLEALESFNKASDLSPNTVIYKVRSIACLYAMDRFTEAILLINKVINENEINEYKANLYVLRARISIKTLSLTECYFDLRRALSLEPNNSEALKLIEQIEETAEQIRNNSLVLSLNNRIEDALSKMNGAITMNPSKAEYNLQRGILYKRLKNFNSAIDDFLLGLEKMNHDQSQNPILFSNFQRHILLTYNDFAIVCFEKGFYDDAIVLLNKAIKIEKNEKGFYINRGDCFYQKKDKRFALLDYEQALEIDQNDQSIKNRIAKICYEMAVEDYDEKNYENSKKFFDLAIKYEPRLCKYYIGRARLSFFLEDKISAQFDICVSILLDPANNEIPDIISRVFVNQDLNDVLFSPLMKQARSYLESLKINSIFNLNENEHSKILAIKPQKQKYRHIMPDPKEVKKEIEQNLQLIEQKRMLKSIIKEPIEVDLKTVRHELKPLPKINTSKNKI